MRIWAGEEVKVDEKELEDSDAMQGIESTGEPAAAGGSASADTNA